MKIETTLRVHRTKAKP